MLAKILIKEIGHFSGIDSGVPISLEKACIILVYGDKQFPILRNGCEVLKVAI